MRTNPVSNYVHHDSTPTSPAYPSSMDSDDEFLLPSGSYLLPRTYFFQCSPEEFNERRALLDSMGYFCFEPVISGDRYNVTYVLAETINSLASDILTEGDDSSSDLEQGEIRD